MAIIAFLLVMLLNTLTIWMSLVGLALAASYPFMKRYTYLPQLYLGMAFGWAIPMAFAAQTGTVPVVAWLLFLANIIWTTVYDTFYAMADREDDLLAGVKSTAVLFGDDDLKNSGYIAGRFSAGAGDDWQTTGLKWRVLSGPAGDGGTVWLPTISLSSS
jgi:4-hydroxybenzoate polyprenyltransferase